MNLFSLLDYSAHRYPRGPAVLNGATVVCDWAELRNRALRLAATLRQTLNKGDRVAIISANCPEYIEIMFATWAAGLTIVPVNVKLHAAEITHILDDADVSFVFTSSLVASILEDQLERQNRKLRIASIGGRQYDSMLGDKMLEPDLVPIDSLAWLFYTSGTTGRPKGAMLSPRNLIAMTIAHLADFECLQHHHGIVHAAPMSHGSGLYILPYVARAARQIVPASGGFQPAEFIDLCRTQSGIGAFLAPTMLRRLRLEVERSGYSPLGLRSIIYGGGPMYVEELKKCLKTFGPILCQLYGQGESPMTITGLGRQDHHDNDDRVLGSVGWPRSGVEVAIFSEAFHKLRQGEIGEIACRSDVVMSGYWNNPEATQQALRDGWLLTGDVGFIDADGKLTLHGRSKELIISGGSNIYPREVEEALLSCPGVREVAVVGQRDPDWGEVVVAFLVVDAASGAIDASVLDRHCCSKIARFKRPKHYFFVEELPKSSYGKVVKRDLMRML